MNKFLTGKPKNVAAWALKANQRPLVVSNAPYYSPPKNYVTIQVFDIAINPIDTILQQNDVFGLRYPAIFGSDVAGEIVEVGEGAEDEFRVGQRVIAQCLPYSNNDPSQGAFQKYTIAPKDAVAELPYSIPTSVGVVLPLGISTAAAGLYQKGFLALPFPSDKPGPLDRVVLIWGGSSSVGSCCIQLAKASGAKVFVTASSKNFDYCKKLGADECFDYHDSNVEKKIVVALGGKTLAGAYHAAGTDETTKTCARILDQSDGKTILVTTRNIPDDGIPSSVRTKMIQATTIFGNEVGRHIWREFLPKALKSGTIVPKPDPLVAGEELRSMQLGLDKMKSGVSAAKVVITNIA